MVSGGGGRSGAERRDIPKVSGLKTSRSRLCNVECLLEVLVQGVEQAIAEAPEEEEDGDKAEGKEGFSEGELGCLCDLVIAHSQGAPLPPLSREHGVECRGVSC